MARFWVAGLEISAQTAKKVASKHGLDIEEIRSHLVCVEGLRHWSDIHPERGPRAFVEIWIGPRRVIAVLYDAGAPLGDVWALGSAYPVD